MIHIIEPAFRVLASLYLIGLAWAVGSGFGKPPEIDTKGRLCPRALMNALEYTSAWAIYGMCTAMCVGVVALLASVAHFVLFGTGSKP